jgi:long-chain acyl-CoA synthetase
VIGDRLKYCVALIALDTDAARAWAKAHGIAADGSDLVANDEIFTAVGREVEHVNERLASYETVKYFRLLPRELTVEDGELTPSMKLKRKVITERYATLVSELLRA